jgi:DNA-binding CsgD family transcriptional regulator
MLTATGTSRQASSHDQDRPGITQQDLRTEVEMDLFSFIDCSNRSQSLSALFELLVNCASEEGFSEVAYGALTYNEPVRLPEHPMPAIAINFPLHWRERYFERKYYEVDPVVRRTPLLSKPFVWDHLVKTEQLQANERLVMEESKEAGLKQGISVPLFGPLGRVSVLSFASRFDDADPVQHMSHLNALAWQFHVAFAEIAHPAEQRKEKIELSERERECLRWTAEGKSSWDIGMILNISDNTVNFHIKKAMRKLSTTSRTVAVVKAIRLNLIDIPGRNVTAWPM